MLLKQLLRADSHAVAEAKSKTFNVVWEPDAEHSACMHCDKKFSLFRRRHHCRLCGDCLCDACCHWHLKVEGSKHPQRVCNGCLLVEEALAESKQIAASLESASKKARSLPRATSQEESLAQSLAAPNCREWYYSSTAGGSANESKGDDATSDIRGPMKEAELLRLRLDPQTTIIWCEGQGDWMSLGDAEKLGVFWQTNLADRVEAAAAKAAAKAAAEAKAEAGKKLRAKTKKLKAAEASIARFIEASAQRAIDAGTKWLWSDGDSPSKAAVITAENAKQYGNDDALSLERAYQQLVLQQQTADDGLPVTVPVAVSVGDGSRHVTITPDLRGMVQTKLSTSFERAVERRSGALASDVVFPETWTRQGDDGKCRDYSWWRDGRCFVDVTEGSAEWEEIGAHLPSGGSGRTSLKLRKVLRVENRLLWQRYCETRARIGRKVGDANERRFLWHGTGAKPAEEVIGSEGGIDFRYARAGFYGRGLYLAELPCYSAHYAHEVTGGGDQQQRKQMIVCRAALGRGHDYGTTTDSDLVAPPPIPGDARGDGYDSVQGGPHTPGGGTSVDKSVMHVLYESCQAYPEYIVEVEEN